MKERDTYKSHSTIKRLTKNSSVSIKEFQTINKKEGLTIEIKSLNYYVKKKDKEKSFKMEIKNIKTD